MRILIVRTSSLGDIVHSLPVLTALRRHFSDSKIAWVVEASYQPLLAGHPDLDEVIPVRLREWRKRLFSPSTYHEVATFIRRLHDFSADTALDLMGNHKAAIVTALSLAERRIGFTCQTRREPSSALWLNELVRPSKVHSTDKMLSLLQALGVPSLPADFGGSKLFPPQVDDSSRVSSDQSSAFLLIHPGTAWGNKCYPPALWGQVAARLGKRLSVDIRVVSGPGEEELAHRVVAAADGYATVTDAPDLSTLASILRRARLVMAGDTGPLHLAHALGSRVLCLMGPTDPAKSGPYASPNLALWKQLPCSFCCKRFDLAKACLLELTPEAISKRAEELLDSAS